MWAITSYFNPLRFKRRRRNYQIFRRHLKVPLLTIEWSPQGAFELGPGDADRLIQVDGGSLMWQKERLLNMAVGHLPGSCEHVAWLDCDIVFGSDDWADGARRALQQQPVVQLFDLAAYLPDLGEELTLADPGSVGPMALARRQGAAASLHQQADQGEWSFITASGASRPSALSSGFAWAARRELLARHPLPDTWIMGGGDTAFLFAALGVPERTAALHGLSPAHRAHYLAWAEGLSRTTSGRVGFVPGLVQALWHGTMEDRKYQERHTVLASSGYDPDTWLMPAASGVWDWSTRAATSALPAAVRRYFEGRREDGDDAPA